MIFSGVAPNTLFYRALTPRWAYEPESGAGAAVVGGRFNRPGVSARYFANSAEGALREYMQESSLLPPATLATYQVTSERIVDFSGGYDPQHWSSAWEGALGNWKQMAFLENVEPPSWTVGDLVRAANAAGILYPSTRSPGVICLVLFPEMNHHFTAPVYDPDGTLPKNPDSWK